MRNAIVIGMLLMGALLAGHAQQATVQQLEQMLAEETAKHPEGADADGLMDQVLREDPGGPRVESLRLTERLTPGTLQRLVAQYKLGPLTQRSLELIADRSALLDPPQAEWLKLPPPDEQAQRRMLAAAGVFVLDTLTHLPNFFAVRTTDRFDDGPVVMSGIMVRPMGEFHRASSTRGEITFRSGKEVVTALDGAKPAGDAANGLDSRGEFGPEAAIVMLDLGHGPIGFHHWEQTVAGPAAVFHYAVPRGASHYLVEYACRAGHIFRDLPGYHGSLAIEPREGALMRVTLEADADKGAKEPLSHVASVIEYGPVDLGSRRYICPVRSLTFMRANPRACDSHSAEVYGDRPVDMMNRTTFTDYHRLGSEATIHPERAAHAPDAAKPARDEARPATSGPQAAAGDAAPRGSSGPQGQDRPPAVAPASESAAPKSPQH